MRKDRKLLEFISNVVGDPVFMARCIGEKNFEVITVPESHGHVLLVFVWQHKKDNWYSCVMGDVTLTTVKGLPTRRAALVALCERLDGLKRRYFIGDKPGFAKRLCERWAKTHKATVETLCGIGAVSLIELADWGVQ